MQSKLELLRKGNDGRFYFTFLERVKYKIVDKQQFQAGRNFSCLAILNINLLFKYHWNYTLAVEVLSLFSKKSLKIIKSLLHLSSEERKSWSFIYLLAVQITAIHISKPDCWLYQKYSRSQAQHTAAYPYQPPHMELHTTAVTMDCKQYLPWYAVKLKKQFPFLAVLRKVTLAFKNKN